MTPWCSYSEQFEVIFHQDSELWKANKNSMLRLFKASLMGDFLLKSDRSVQISPLKIYFWTVNTFIDYFEWSLQHFGKGLFQWLCSCVLIFWACQMLDDVWAEGKDRCCPPSELWTLLNLWREIGVDSIFFSLPLCVYVPWLSLSTHSSSLPPTHFPQFHLFALWIFIILASLVGPLSSSVPFPPPPLSATFRSPTSHFPPAVRSWVLRSGCGWPVLAVRAWRAGRCLSMTANAVPLATMWREVLSWWVGARPKCRRVGASMTGPALGPRWGWRVKLALQPLMVSYTYIRHSGVSHLHTNTHT